MPKKDKPATKNDTDVEISVSSDIIVPNVPRYEPPDIREELDKARALVAAIREEPAIFSASGPRVAACDQLTTILDAINRRVLDPKDE